MKTKPVAKASKKKAKKDSEDEMSGGDDNDDIEGGSTLSKTPPKKAPKKTAPPKKNNAQPLANISNESLGLDGSNEAAPSGPNAVSASEKYQKVCH